MNTLICESVGYFENLQNIFFNIVGGILVAIIIWFYQKSREISIGYKFKKLFGDKIDNYSVIYGELVLEDEITSIYPFPFKKDKNNIKIKSTKLIAFADARAANYILTEFNNRLTIKANLKTDIQFSHTPNISCCSIGGYSNDISSVILNSESNKYLELKFEISRSWIKNKSEVGKTHLFNSKHDLCAIIKIIDNNNVKICIAGLGEWGTSGGAWYLANKWKELLKIVKENEFGAIVKVEHFRDDSAELLEVIYGPELKTKTIKEL